MERVVVTGLGVVSPLGLNCAEFWGNLLAGRSGVVSLTDPAYAKLPTRIAAVASGYHVEEHFQRKEARRLSRTSQMALVAAAQAMDDAGLTQSNSGVDLEAAGVIIGSSIGGFSAGDGFSREYHLRGQTNPLIIPISMNHGPSTNVSLRYGMQGPLMTVDAACASAAHSIGYAFNLIRMGRMPLAVTGGADTPLSSGIMAAWCALKALSERNDSPATACRPFSADRDGMVLGEGAGVLVLEAESVARRRGARILGEILGYGSTSDSHHLTQPTLQGPARAMRQALGEAGLAPEQIDYINAHATATSWNDKTETAAIKAVFGERAYAVPVVGNKAALGHSIGASGALELIGCLLALRDQVLPPTINYTTRDPDCDLDYVSGGCRRRPLRYIMSNSFAFGGSNGVLVIGPYEGV
jgi:beta-ketoacyl-acyl-carrier-protein synthase II